MSVRVDFSSVSLQDEAYRQERIEDIRERMRQFKSAGSKRPVKNLKRLRAEQAALDAAWNASAELAKAQARLQHAQAVYDGAFKRAIACTNAYLRRRGVVVEGNWSARKRALKPRAPAH